MLSTKSLIGASVLCGLIFYLLYINLFFDPRFSLSFSGFKNVNSSLSPSKLLAEKFIVDSRDHHPRDAFTFDNVLHESPDSSWNQTFADMINDYNNRSACVHQSEWVWFDRAFELWVALAKEAKVPWMLAFGSLLGYARDKNYIAYDSDVDVIVPHWSYELLNRYASELPVNTSRYHFRGWLFLHPEFLFVPHGKRREFLCNGTIAKSYDGRCGFVSPMGRLFYNGRFVDIFSGDHYPDLNDSFVYDTGYRAIITPARRHFPRRPCTFAGHEAWCPYDYASVARLHFGPQMSAMRPYYLCNALSRRQESEEEAPEVHRAKNQEWEKRWNLSLVAELTEEDKIFEAEYNKMRSDAFCLLLNESDHNIYRSAICRREFDEPAPVG